MGFETTTEDVLLKAVGDAKRWTKPWTTAIYGIDGEGLKLAGSATYVRVCGQLLLLTAEHVLQTALSIGRVARGSSEVAREVRDWVIGPPNLDIVVIFAGADSCIEPASLSVFAGHSNDVDEQHLLIQGFPDSQSHWSVFAGGPVSDTLPYLTYTDPTGWAGYDRENHFAIEFPGPERYQISESGKPVTLPCPKGLSGCAVWGLGRSLHGFTGKGKLVGVVHRHVEDKHAFLVTRVEPVLAFVLELLRQRAAYFNWEQRGRPLWDDLTDWDAAVSSLPVLT